MYEYLSLYTVAEHQNLTELNSIINKSKSIVGYLNIPLSAIDRIIKQNN